MSSRENSGQYHHDPEICIKWSICRLRHIVRNFISIFTPNIPKIFPA